MKFCALCQKQPAIANSHIVPNFMVRRLKAGTPHGTLRHSTNLRRAEQDGWKGTYFCAGCEAQFSKWEGAFCRGIYDPLTKHNAQTFAIDEKIALFAASLHFRGLVFGMTKHPTGSADPRLTSLCERLRQLCLRGILPATPLHSFLEILKPVTDVRRYPPGINTYFFESIDMELFPWHLPSSQTIWMSHVKAPTVSFFLADDDLEKACSVPGMLDAYRLRPNAVLDATAHHGVMIEFVRKTSVRRAHEIQANYAAIPAQQLAKMTSKIQSEPNPAQFRGHQSYLLDMVLVQQLAAMQAQAGQ